MFLFVPKPQEAKADGASWYNSSWLYRKPVTVDNASGTSTLTNYQVQVSVTYNSKMQSNFNDIRFTDSDGTTLLDHWLEASTSSVSAIFWVKVPSIAATSTKNIYMYYGNSDISSYDYFKITIDSTAHTDYGLSYPVTYKFTIPSGSSGLKAYKRYSTSSPWTQITEKTANDSFDGIEAVRFDYNNNATYISASFDGSSDDMLLKITDSNDRNISSEFTGITKYYDNRSAAVVATGDDWGRSGRNTAYKQACDVFAAAHVWFTPGIVTNDPTPELVWSDIQSKVNQGYIEIASHSRTHTGLPYSDYDSEIAGSKADIIANLDLPAFQKKGLTEYVYTWIRPYGQTTTTVSTKLGVNKYLVDRSIDTILNTYQVWDSTYGLYLDIATSYFLDTGNLIDANAKFDTVKAAGGIYHFWMHADQLDWSDGSWVRQHIDHIKDQKDIWYTGFGYLYLYRYIFDNLTTKVNVLKIGNGSNGNNTFTFYDDFNDNFLTAIKWQTGTLGFEQNSRIELTANGGYLKTIGTYDLQNTSVQMQVVAETANKNYFQLTDSVGTVANQFSESQNAYRFGKESNILYIQRRVSGTQTTRYTTAFTNTSYKYRVRLIGTTIYFDIDTGSGFQSIYSETYALPSTILYLTFSNQAVGYTYLDNFIYQQLVSPNPSASIGSEDGYPVAPTISTPTVLPSSAIRWNFTDNSSYETGFRVYTNVDAVATSSATANLSSLTETGLSENTQYTRYIKAYNSYGESASSSATSTYTLVDTPTGFNFMRHPSSLDIYVDSFPNSSLGLSGYLFWRTDNSAYNSGWIQTNNWQDPNMVEGQTYTYAVKYRNGNGVETATTTLTGVSFVHSSGGGGTPLEAPLLTGQAPTSTIATSTQVNASTDSTSSPQTSSAQVPNLAGLTGQARQVAIQQIRDMITQIQKQLIILIGQLIQALQAELSNMLGH